MITFRQKKSTLETNCWLIFLIVWIGTSILSKGVVDAYAWRRPGCHRLGEWFVLFQDL